jgi:hypothetical protein
MSALRHDQSMEDFTKTTRDGHGVAFHPAVPTNGFTQTSPARPEPGTTT